jgi:hypothetical protein
VARDPLPRTPSFDRFARRHRQGIWRRRGIASPSTGRERGPSRPCERPGTLERPCEPGPTGQSRDHKPVCLLYSTPISARMHARRVHEAPRLEPLKSAVRPLFDKWGPCREPWGRPSGVRRLRCRENGWSRLRPSQNATQRHVAANGSSPRPSHWC